MPQDPEYNEFDPKQAPVGKDDILTPPLQRVGDSKNPFSVIPNQKIVVVSEDLPGLRNFIERQKQSDRSGPGKPGTPGEVIPRPPALENSANNFFGSLLNLLRGWLRWLFGDKQPTNNEQPAVREDGTFAWSFADDPKKAVHFRIVRASECPNGKGEYGQGPSVNVLLEARGAEGRGGRDLTPFAQLYAQADNHFITNPQPPTAEVSPPINTKATIMNVHNSDFMVFDSTVAASYSPGIGKEPIVAVMDTGLKYKWISPDSSEDPAPLIDVKGNPFEFKISKAPADSCTSETSFGYCSIGHYIQKPVPFRQLGALTPFTTAQIKSSPYDDHKVDEKIEDEKFKGGVQERFGVGRHGTLITAILNEHGCRVLPVKSFNCAGQGTLFDILDGLNYLITKKNAGMPIKVLNASFGGRLDAAALNLLRRKMTTLTDLGVWVVTSAGNEDINIDGLPIYPAQFGWPGGSDRLNRVITVNSYYGGGIQGNRGAAVSITAESGAPDGFPSVLPLGNSPNNTLLGTSFAAPYVACALARLDTSSGRNTEDVLNEIVNTPIGEVNFSRNS